MNSISVLIEYFKGRNGTFNPPQRFSENWISRTNWLFSKFDLKVNRYVNFNNKTISIICKGEPMNNYYNYRLRPTKYENVFIGKYHSDTSNNIPNLLRQEKCKEWCRTHIKY